MGNCEIGLKWRAASRSAFHFGLIWMGQAAANRRVPAAVLE
jgi:hypothetical protein